MLKSHSPSERFTTNNPALAPDQDLRTYNGTHAERFAPSPPWVRLVSRRGLGLYLLIGFAACRRARAESTAFTPH
jgi:hypothetical protein